MNDRTLTFQVWCLTKNLAKTTLGMFIMATPEVALDLQISATTPQVPTHPSTVEVCSYFAWTETEIKSFNIFPSSSLVGLTSVLLLLDTSDRQPRSASLSSDDVMGLSQSQQTLSRSSTLPYDHTPQRAQPQRGGGVRKPRSSSPGSEMVTLEQFLQESNLQSPPMVKPRFKMP